MTVIIRSADTLPPWAWKAIPPLAVNKAMNKTYVANVYDGAVTVIDGVINHASTVRAEPAPIRWP